MWVLESHGDIFQGKRMWLKPGKQYLFGRVKKDGVRFAIDHKTVSRKHFIIDVSPVAENEVNQIHARTRITVIDQASKSGTTVNGEQMKGKEHIGRELKHTENSVRPGSSEELVIRWIPCVLTFYLLKKEIKAGALAARQARAKNLGIKALSDFLSDNTTHVVAAKRNTPKGLQALIIGKHLVSDGFLDALELAATPTTLSQDENPSALELDWDAAWPNEFNYLPAPGKEPTLQPNEKYQPSSDRSDIFENYIFVFGDQAQYENLLPVITVGHGKALHLKINYGQTTVDDASQFMENAAGRKTFGDAGDSSSGGVILVRWNAPPEHEDWANQLIAQVSLKLDQRAIDQSEFLDAILANNPSQLRKAVPVESFNEGLRAPPPSAAQSFAPGRGNTQVQTNGSTPKAAAATQAMEDVQQNVNSSRQTRTSRKRSTEVRQETAREEEAPAQLSQAVSEVAPSQVSTSQPSGRKARFIPPIKVQKFDDNFDPNDIVPFDDEDSGSEPSMVNESEVEEEAPQQTPTASARPPTSQRKRRRSPSPEREEGDGMDALLPAANAMKRQRREWEEEARRAGEPLQPTTTIKAVSKAPKKPELNVREAMQKQRERQKAREAENRSDDESVSPVPEIHEPANLAVIEYIDLPVRHRPNRNRNRNGTNPEDDPRWDDRWNGLKNFKKFKPQEKGAVRRSTHATRVIVPLVAVAQKTGGMGEKYWEKTDEQKELDKRRKLKKQRQRAQESLSQSQNQSRHSGGADAVMVSDDDSDNDGDRSPAPRSRPNSSRRTIRTEEDSDADEAAPNGTARTSPETNRLQEEAAAILDHEVDIDSPRRTRADDNNSRRTQTQTQTQTKTKQSSSKKSQPAQAATAGRGTKRPAAASSGATTTAKRQKTLPVTMVRDSDEEEESDDSDGGKFKFGKGRGRRPKGR